MSLESIVYGVYFWNIAGLNRQIMAHEAVKVSAICLLPEVQFHRPPIVLIEKSLQPRFKTHQNEIADKIGLGQLTPGRVHALENELRVVLVPV